MNRIFPRWYILDGHTPIPADRETASQFLYESDNSRVALTHVGPWEVSTVFLGMDRRFYGGWPPLLFETLVFRDGTVDNDQTQERYCTWEEALAGHERIVGWLHTRWPEDAVNDNR